MPNIALDDVISVEVSAAARPAVREGYNVGLIVGQSARIPQSARCVEFASLAEMEAYGFQATDAEYLAAIKYFGQAEVPLKLVVGIMCPANVTQTIPTPTVTGGGVTSPVVAATTFSAAVGDKNGVYVFAYNGTAWTLGGKVIGDASALSAAYGITYTGTPTAATSISVTYVSGATAETWVEAIADARNKNNDWYGVYVADDDGLGSSDITAIAAYVETLTALFFFDDSSADDLTNGTTDVFSTLDVAGLRRWCGLYSSTQYAGAAVMGYAMGANTGSVNSAYTMAYKSLSGVDVDDLSVAQISNLKGKGANYYILRGGTYRTFEPGTAGYLKEWVDELIGIDQLTHDLQTACMDVLTSVGKVPYTDSGVLQFVVACNAVCDEAVRTGFLASGVWNGNTVLNLNRGDTLEGGYMVQVESVASQSAEQKANRVCPPVYVCAILAGAVHSVVIKVDVE